MAASWSAQRAQTFGWAIRVCVAFNVALIALGLWLWGAVEVRGHSDQVIFLTLLGASWLIVSMHLFPWLGLCIADDVIERGNPAALVALCGAIFGVSLVYVGGSLGEGPSYWNNIFSAALGTLGLFVLWLSLELAGDVSMLIAEERDFPSGVRLGAFLLAAGLVLGRAVAGNWHSEPATVRDFIRDGWPAAGLFLLAAITERFTRPTRCRPAPGWVGLGLLPAAIYVGVAISWIWHLGRWEGMPK